MPRPRNLRRLFFIAVTCGACGPDDLGDEPAMLGERCGSTEPTQLLPLLPEEIVSFGANSTAPYEDGWLVAVTTLDAPFDGTLAGQAVAHRVVSVDACGQREPELVLEGVDRIFPPPASGDLPWLACSSATDEMFTFDPEGEGQASSQGVVEHCLFRVSGDRIWMSTTRNGGQHELISLSPSPGGIAGTTSWTVTDELAPGLGSFAVDAAGDYAWMVNDAGELIEIELEPRGFTLLAEGVGTVFTALDGRFVVWGSEADTFTPGEWTILDRESGEHIDVDVDGERELLVRGSPFSLVFEAGRDEQTSDYAIVRLPTLEVSALTGGRWGRFVDNGPGDMVLLELGPEPDLHVLRSGSSTPELLYEGNVVDFRVDDGVVWAWDYYDYQPSPALRDNQTRLVRIPLDGSAPEVVVDGVWQPRGLDDGRWLAVQDHGGDGLGELRVLDPVEGTSQWIDDDVSLWFTRLSGFAHSFSGETTLSSDDPFLYSVHHSERSGLWAATLAARE
ncbi:MAG: hypothetical protein AAF799_14375 [Myxococcota bacterium]